jgi:hypothetical protein
LTRTARDARYRRKHRDRRRRAAWLWRLLNLERHRHLDRLSKRRLWKFRRLLDLNLKLETIMTATLEAPAEELAAAGLKLLPTDALRSEFHDGIAGLAVPMRRLGLILIELESRGEHVKGDKRLLNVLRRVGAGELLADVAAEELAKSRRAEPEAAGDDDHPARARKATPPVTMEAIVQRAKRSEPADLAVLLVAMVKANPHAAEVRRLLLDLLARL